MEAFEYVSFAQEIVFGPGALDRLKELVERGGWQRVMLCTSRSQRASGRAETVANALGGCLVSVYDEVQPHVQDFQVDEVVNRARQQAVQAVIGLGGGSPIGMAKAAAHALADQEGGRVSVIAIPGTYAGSEMTAVYGVTQTRDSLPRKVTVSDARIAPRLVIYDPQITLDLPPQITAATGINALAHCIEALYSVTRNPLSSAAATRGIRHIMHALPRCYSEGSDLEARGEMLLGAHLAGLALASVKMGLHHGLCHVLGGALNIPHGIANSIILPHAVRFNAEAAAGQLVEAAQAAAEAQPGGPPAQSSSPASVIEAFARQICGLTAQMKLPQRLRDAGIKETDLPRLAQLGFENRTVHNNPRPVTSVEQIERLLREAW